MTSEWGGDAADTEKPLIIGEMQGSGLILGRYSLALAEGVQLRRELDRLRAERDQLKRALASITEDASSSVVRAAARNLAVLDEMKGLRSEIDRINAELSSASNGVTCWTVYSGGLISEIAAVNPVGGWPGLPDDPIGNLGSAVRALIRNLRSERAEIDQLKAAADHALEYRDVAMARLGELLTTPRTPPALRVTHEGNRIIVDLVDLAP